MSSERATRDIANWAVSRARTNRVKTDVSLEPIVLRTMGHRSRIATLCLLVQCALFVACSAAPEPPLTMLGAPGRANANVSMAASGEFVAVAWSGAEPGGSMDIYLSVSTNSGEAFSAPVPVNRTPGEARVNGEQPPRVALVPRTGRPPSIVVVWTARATTGTILLSARSDDGGRTFGASSLIPGTDAPGNRGWQTVGVDPDGQVHVVWLDHRRLAADSKVESTHRHGGTAESGTSGMAQFSDLYFAALDGPTLPMPLTAGVCYCCKTAVALGSEGRIHLAWRHVYPGNLRDIAFVTVKDGLADGPQRVSEDRWMLQGCPDDGPAMGAEERGRVHIVWPTVVTDQGTPQKVLFHAASVDGRTFTARTRLPVEGQANHPQIAVARDGMLLLAWDEVHEGERRVVVARGTARGDGGDSTPVFQRDQSLGDPAGVYPAIALTPTTAIVAWTSGSPADSTIAVLRMPAVR
jgi:hypothetical protein